MSILSDLAAGAASGLFSSIGSFAKDIREAITGKSILDPNKQAELESKAMEIEYAVIKAQTDINLEEAKNPNLFVSGWRPFVGWTCGFALGWQFIGSPIFEWVIKLMGKNIVAPTLDTNSLITILFALLGLGGMRTYEKTKEAQGNH
jgi:hypothetical protein